MAAAVAETRSLFFIAASPFVGWVGRRPARAWSGVACERDQSRGGRPPSAVSQVTNGQATEGRSYRQVEANKQIVLLGMNGTALISYSGLAHIDGQPTDQWIASLVHGQPLLSLIHI